MDPPVDEQPFNITDATSMLKYKHIWPTILILFIIGAIVALFYLVFISRTITVPPLPTPGPTPTPTPVPGATPVPPPRPTPAPMTVYGEFIQYEFENPIILDAYVLKPRFADEMPIGHLVLGSNNGSSWDLISVQTNVGWNDNVPITFNLPNDMTYRILRLVVLQMSLSNNGYMTLQFTPQYQYVSLFAEVNNFRTNELLKGNSRVATISVSFIPVSTDNDGVCTTWAGFAVSLLSLTNSICRFPLKSSIYALPEFLASSGTMTIIGRNISGTPFVPTPFKPLPPPVTPGPTPTPGPTATPPPIPQIAGLWILSKSPFKKWVALSLNASGQYQTALEFNGSLFCSNDYGINWVRAVSLTNNWSFVKSSYTGQYQTAAIFNGPLYATSNYGVSWTAMDISDAWNGLALSASGQYQFATAFNSYLWYSSNYGLTWSMTTAQASTTVMTSAWTSCAVSSNGNYVVATVLNGGIFTSMNMGVTWVKSNAPNGAWSSIAMSYDGQTVSACQNNGAMFRSTNYGQTWVSASFPITLTSTQLSNTKCSSLAMSFDGTIQVCTIRSIGVYQSLDSGKNWSLDTSVPPLMPTTPLTTPLFRATSLSWVAIALNYNGQMKSIIENTVYVWQKENIRAPIPNWFNWSLPRPIQATSSTPSLVSYASPIQNWTDIRISSSGQYQVASASTGIFVSNNYGQYWVNVFAGSYNNVAISSAGKFMSASQSTGGITVSSNYGLSWSNVSVPPSLWRGIAMSADGAKQLAVIQGGGHYMSTDFGKNWSLTNAPVKAWTSITMSADGTILSAAAQNDTIYSLTPNTNNTWRATSSIKSNWVKVACSANGIFQTALINNGRIYSSINRGVTWNESNSPIALWRSVAISNLGDIQVAVAFRGGIYWSYDYGSNWVISTNTLISPWTGIGISYNGSFMSATQTSDSVYLYSQQNTSYSTIQGDWIQIKFENPTPISSYQLTPRQNNTETMIKSFMILGSMDGFSWVYLDNQTQFVWGSVPSTFYVNTSAFVYVRLIVTDAPMLFEIGGWILNDAAGRPILSDSYIYTPGPNSITLSMPAPTPAPPRPTPTPTVTSTPRPSPTVTSTPTPTVTSTPRPSPTVTSTPTPTVTSTPTPTVTSTPTPTVTSTPTPTITPTPLPPRLIATVSWSWASTLVTSGSSPANVITANGYSSGSYLGIQIPVSVYIVSGVLSDTLTVFQYLTPTQTNVSWMAMGEWIQVQLTVPSAVSAFQLIPLSNKVESLPNSFVVVGSNDGLVWSLVSSVTNQFIFFNGATTYPVLANIPYRFYRLVMTHAHTTVGISGFILLDTLGKSLFGTMSNYTLSGPLQNSIS